MENLNINITDELNDIVEHYKVYEVQSNGPYSGEALIGAKNIVHEPHGKPWGVWQHTLVVNSLMCNETIQTSRRESLALR